jgi:hypothetical protein
MTLSTRPVLTGEELAIVKNLDLLVRARRKLTGKLAHEAGVALADSLLKYLKKKEFERFEFTPIEADELSGDDSEQEPSGDDKDVEANDWRDDFSTAFNETLKGEVSKLKPKGGGELSFSPLELYLVDGQVIGSVSYLRFARSLGKQKDAEEALEEHGLLLEKKESWYLCAPERPVRHRNWHWDAKTRVPIKLDLSRIKDGLAQPESRGIELLLDQCWPDMKRVIDDYVELENKYSELSPTTRKQLLGGNSVAK